MEPLAQFVYISNQVAIATGVLTAMICYVPKPASGGVAARLPSSTREAIPAIPSSATVASSHPGSGEYVALSTLADGDKPANGAPGMGDGLAALDTGGGIASKVGRVVATDLRIRFAAILAGLWVLNVVCASARLLFLSLEHWH
jgi:hypothetical protein